MEHYNYHSAVKEDIQKYINDNYIFVCSENVDEVEKQLNEVLFFEDSVTGNASVSYTFNAWTAEENLCHNLDLLKEACEEFGNSLDILENPEAADVIIRCYILNTCIHKVLKKYCH